MITSAHNLKIQTVQKLLRKPKERLEEKAFLAEGVRLVEEAAAAGWPFRFGLYSDELNERGNELVKSLQGQGVAFEKVSTDLFRSVCDTINTQGILAVLEQANLALPGQLSFALVLDSIRDPGNLGSLLRTAAAAGVQAVFLPPETTDAFAPKVVRAGMGAHFHMPVIRTEWEELRQILSGMEICLAEMEAETPFWLADFKQPLAVIVGGEAEGASKLGRSLATRLVSIPMPGKSESLNAAAAGAILLFEVVRQRNA
jgi:RNA methyltransferase, TrmH family